MTLLAERESHPVTISHHLGKLKAAGLVESSKQGIWITTATT